MLLSELLDEEVAAAGFPADGADRDRQQQDHRPDQHALDTVLKSGYQVLERHALGQRHPCGQQERGAERPVHVGRSESDERSHRKRDQRSQRQEELQDVRLVALRHVAALQLLCGQRRRIRRIKRAGLPATAPSLP